MAPGLDEHAALAARAEPFDRQALVAELAVEALIRAVLPWLARIVEHGGDAGLRDPFQDGTADKLRPLSERMNSGEPCICPCVVANERADV